MSEKKSKLEIKVLIQDKKNDTSALLSIDCLKTMDLSSLTHAERGNISFAVCETEVTSLKTRHEPHYKASILPYGTYKTFEEALNYYVHKLTGEPLKEL